MPEMVNIHHILEAKEICNIIIEPSSRPVYYRECNDVKFCHRTGGGVPVNCMFRKQRNILLIIGLTDEYKIDEVS